MRTSASTELGSKSKGLLRSRGGIQAPKRECKRKRLTVPVLSVLVPNLSSRSPSAVLPVLCVSRVKIAPDDALVEFGPRDVAERGDGILVGKEPAGRRRAREGVRGQWKRPLPALRTDNTDSLYEAETARGLLVAVESHDDSLDVSDSAEQLVDLFLGREKAARDHSRINGLSLVQHDSLQGRGSREVSDVDGRRDGEVGMLDVDRQRRARVAIRAVRRQRRDDRGRHAG